MRFISLQVSECSFDTPSILQGYRITPSFEYSNRVTEIFQQGPYLLGILSFIQVSKGDNQWFVWCLGSLREHL
jgi:hypothetical protein